MPKIVRNVGSKVEVVGDKTSFSFVPRQRNRFITKAENVALEYV